ncbi:MAG: hypothetical protein HOD64_12560 [Candidatus Cloacimonetes bacterium]|jgi:hypothetical protein|nr:hypothetical protein [Candidatus Cloacimonadota bacterium]
MKNLITEKYKHLLYKDEINDPFILTSKMEIYQKSETTLGCYCWSFRTTIKLSSLGIIFNEWSTSDGLYTFETNNENLDVLIQCGAPKRRVHKSGKWIKSREEKLAHCIIPFNPVSYNKITLQQEKRTL